jgi:hypothetical protein
MADRGTDGTAPVELGPPVSGPVHSKLLLSPHADGISCTVTGDGDSASPPFPACSWLNSGPVTVGYQLVYALFLSAGADHRLLS